MLEQFTGRKGALDLTRVYRLNEYAVASDSVLAVFRRQDTTGLPPAPDKFESIIPQKEGDWKPLPDFTPAQPQMCSFCLGTGAHHDECESCNGSGSIGVMAITHENVKCTVCKGTGLIQNTGICSMCYGTSAYYEVTPIPLGGVLVDTLQLCRIVSVFGNCEYVSSSPIQNAVTLRFKGGYAVIMGLRI